MVQGHPGEKEIWVGGVLGRGLPPCQHPGMPQSLTRSPGLPSLPSSPSKPAGPCGDKVRVSGWFGPRGSEGPRGTRSGHPRPWERGTGPWGMGPASSAPQQHHDTSGPAPSPHKGGIGRGSYLDARGSGRSRGPWHPRGATHALAALQEPQVKGAAGAGQGSATPQSRGQTEPTSPRDERCHRAATSRWHSPSRPRAPVARLDQPSLGSPGAPKERRGVK